jgi:pimeloyl-ACP methyl ester carboxylesterase
MSTTNSKTILFITGAFVHNSCWDEWKLYFEDRGYKTLAPPWPNKDGSVQQLRHQHSAENIASMRLAELISYYQDIAVSLSERPIIVGHSIGGLVAQILNEKGKAAAAVAIHSVPPQGLITFKLSFLIAGWGPLGFFTSVKKPFMMSFKQWQYAFTNGLPLEIQKSSYAQLAIPESKNIVRDTITSVAKVDFKKPHQPLLFIAGTADHTIPYSLNHSNYKKYTDKNSITDYVSFDDITHFVLGQSGWKEIASYIQLWLESVANEINKKHFNY